MTRSPQRSGRASSTGPAAVSFVVGNSSSPTSGRSSKRVGRAEIAPSCFAETFLEGSGLLVAAFHATGAARVHGQELVARRIVALLAVTRASISSATCAWGRQRAIGRALLVIATRSLRVTTGDERRPGARNRQDTIHYRAWQCCYHTGRRGDIRDRTRTSILVGRTESRSLRSEGHEPDDCDYRIGASPWNAAGVCWLVIGPRSQLGLRSRRSVAVADVRRSRPRRCAAQ